MDEREAGDPPGALGSSPIQRWLDVVQKTLPTQLEQMFLSHVLLALQVWLRAERCHGPSTWSSSSSPPWEEEEDEDGGLLCAAAAGLWDGRARQQLSPAWRD